MRKSLLAIAAFVYLSIITTVGRDLPRATEAWPGAETQACVAWGNACSATVHCCAGSGSCMVVAGGKRKCCFAVSQGFCQ